MAHIKIKTCPHCHQLCGGGGTDDNHGCPLVTCAKCGKMFWDNEIHEPALYAYKSIPQKITVLEKAGLMYTPLILVSLALIVVAVKLVLEPKYSIIEYLPILLAIGFAILFFWLFINCRRDRIKEINERDGTVAKQQCEYDASVNRLQNTNYLQALAKYDVRARELLKARQSGKPEKYAKRPE